MTIDARSSSHAAAVAHLDTQRHPSRDRSLRGPVAEATLHDVIVDSDDALIPNATVTLTLLSGKTQTATSKADGILY
jgi:hypothetical protein